MGWSSWGSQGKNTEVVCHSLPQWTTFFLRSGAVTRGVTLHPRSRVATRGVTPLLRSGAVARRRYPMPKPEARGGGRKDQPHVQGAVAEWTLGGLEELSHTEGQEGRR